MPWGGSKIESECPALGLNQTLCVWNIDIFFVENVSKSLPLKQKHDEKHEENSPFYEAQRKNMHVPDTVHTAHPSIVVPLLNLLSLLPLKQIELKSK